MLEHKEVIITGRAGLVGSRVYELLSGRYKFGIDLDLQTTGTDITDPNQVNQALESSRGDIVLHFAAFTDVGKAFEQKSDLNGLCYQVNVIGTQNVAQACARFGKHLIHVSTDYVHDGNSYDYYTEESPRNPIEWYGKTKTQAEELVEETCHSYTIMRIAAPYRAEYRKRFDLVRRIQNGIAERTLPPQFSDNILTPTFVDDIAEAVDVIIRERPQGILNVVGSSSLSAYELGCKVARASGYDASLIQKGSLTQYLQESGRPYHRHLRISNKRAVEKFQIPMHDIDEGLDIVVSQQRSAKR